MFDLAAFSFYPTKVLGGFGYGGMIITNDENFYETVRRLRFYSMKHNYYSEESGYNSRFDEIHAEILLHKLSHLDNYIVRRREIAHEYDQFLAKADLSLPRTMPGDEHVYHLFVCRHLQRDRIISLLRTKEIIVNINYPWPIHAMAGYRYLGYKIGDLPHTEKAAREIFNLPMYTTLSNEEQKIVIAALHNILRDIE